MTRTRVKICGLTRMGDAYHAIRSGVDAIGFVFAKSPRQVSRSLARDLVLDAKPMVGVIGVFADQPLSEVLEVAVDLGLSAIQLHGNESISYCAQLREALPGGIRVVRRMHVLDGDTAAALRQRLSEDLRPANAVLLDPGAGSGRAFDWSMARGLFDPLIVSGGLTPENVGTAIWQSRPYAVDVSSGVEISPGIKDAARMRAFVDAVRQADGRVALESPETPVA